MVEEALAYVQGESLKAGASLANVAFSTPRSPEGRANMREKFASYLVIVGMFLRTTTAADGEDAQYNQNLARQREQISQLKVSVEACMNEGSRAMLMQGNRSRDDITQFTVTRCGVALRTLLMKTGMSNTQAVTELIHMADKQLDAVTANGQ
jgi:hypothetical protein